MEDNVFGIDEAFENIDKTFEQDINLEEIDKLVESCQKLEKENMEYIERQKQKRHLNKLITPEKVKLFSNFMLTFLKNFGKNPESLKYFNDIQILQDKQRTDVIFTACFLTSLYLNSIIFKLDLNEYDNSIKLIIIFQQLITLVKAYQSRFGNILVKMGMNKLLTFLPKNNSISY